MRAPPRHPFWRAGRPLWRRRTRGPKNRRSDAQPLWQARSAPPRPARGIRRGGSGHLVPAGAQPPAIRGTNVDRVTDEDFRAGAGSTPTLLHACAHLLAFGGDLLLELLHAPFERCCVRVGVRRGLRGPAQERRLCRRWRMRCWHSNGMECSAGSKRCRWSTSKPPRSTGPALARVPRALRCEKPSQAGA